MSCPVCQCTFANSNCVHFLGRGTVDDPYLPELVADPNGIASCSPGGLGVFLPPPFDNPPSVFLGIPTAQTIAAKTTQVVFFTAVLYDTDNMHDSSNPSRITFNAPGLYQVEAYVLIGATQIPQQAFSIRQNSVAILGRWELESVGAPFMVQSEFNVGDYVEVLATNNSTGDFPIPAPNEEGLFLFHFSAQFMRPL